MRAWHGVQVRSRPLSGTAQPALVDAFYSYNVTALPAFTQRYYDVSDLIAGKGYQVRRCNARRGAP